MMYYKHSFYDTKAPAIASFNYVLFYPRIQISFAVEAVHITYSRKLCRRENPKHVPDYMYDDE